MGKILSAVLFTGHLIRELVTLLLVSKRNDLLAKISRENKICFIMGDFNLNLIIFQHHQNTGEFLDGLHLNMFFSHDNTSHPNNFSHRNTAR